MPLRFEPMTKMDFWVFNIHHQTRIWDTLGRFHQRFSRAFFLRLIQNITRKKMFVRKTRAKNVGEIDTLLDLCHQSGWTITTLVSWCNMMQRKQQFQVMQIKMPQAYFFNAKIIENVNHEKDFLQQSAKAQSWSLLVFIPSHDSSWAVAE